MVPEYEAVIGLEVHAELRTDSKMFCGCSAKFGAPPNTQTCPVCLGMPGVLPVVNRKAFEQAMLVALAMNCKLPKVTRYDRKNYYYPDLPKNYQISQLYANLGTEGCVELFLDGETKRVGILNVHLEEDAGKLLHPETPGADYSLVDLNRAGVPLLEVVSAPDMRSAEEVDVFMRTIRDVLLYLEASDCKMEEGSLRFEASISLRPKGEEALGARVEIKNLNSMKAVTKVVEYEMERQERLLRSGKEVPRETRLWDEEREVSQSMRSKETASDYRYFPEPDLVPIALDEDWVETVRQRLIELPHYRRRRFVSEYKLSEYKAAWATQTRKRADSLEAGVKAGVDADTTCNSLMRDEDSVITVLLNNPDGYRIVTQMVQEGLIGSSSGSEAISEAAASGKDPRDIVREWGLEQISEETQLAALAQEVIEKNPKAVEDYRKGKKTAIKFLVGQVMKESKGRANPKVVADVLQRLLDAK